MKEWAHRFNEGKFASYFEVRAYAPYLGLAFTYVWIFSVQRSIPNKLDGYFNVALFAGIALANFVLAILSAKTGRNRASYAVLVRSVPFVASLCAVALNFSSFVQGSSIAVLVLGVVCGATIGWLYVLWGSFYSGIRTKTTIALLFSSVALASVCKIVFSLFNPGIVGQLICVAAPLVSAWCWAQSSMCPLSSSIEGAPRFTKGTLYVFKSMALGIAAFSFAIGVIRSADLTFFSQPFLFEVLAHVLTVAGCVGVVLWTYRNREDVEFFALWMFTLLFIATGLVSAVYLPGIANVSLAILTAAQMFFLVFLYLGLANVAHNSSFPSDAVFGVGWGMYSSFVALGSFWARTGANIDLVHVALLVVYILLIASVLLMRERAPRELRLLYDLNPPLSRDMLTSFESQVEALATRYKLTEREMEIVTLYAQGRTRGFIGSCLFISENTVRDHIKNVYKKAHIHSKQELIDLLQ